MPTPRSSTLSVLATLALSASLHAQGFGQQDGPTLEPWQPAPAGPSLRLGPVAGLTTAWHAVPGHFAVPQGTELMFDFEWSQPHLVEWEGATAVGFGATNAQASAFMDELGDQQVSLTATSPAGEFLTGWIVDVEVLPADAFRVELPLPELFHVDVSVDPAAPVLMGSGGAAPIYLGRGPRKVVGHGGPLGAALLDAPEPLHGLLEWRLDGEAIGLGAVTEMVLDAPGSYLLEVGAPQNAAKVQLHAPETYALPSGWINGAGGGIGIGCKPCVTPVKCGVTKDLVGGPGLGHPAVIVRNTGANAATFTISTWLNSYTNDCTTSELNDFILNELPPTYTKLLKAGQVSVVHLEGSSDCEVQLAVEAKAYPAIGPAGGPMHLICTRNVWSKL